NGLAHRLDGPGEIEAENGRQRMVRVRGGAGADLDVERIDATCCNAHQRLAGPRDRTRNRGEAKRRLVPFEHGGLHRCCRHHGGPPCSTAARWPLSACMEIKDTAQCPCISVWHLSSMGGEWARRSGAIFGSSWRWRARARLAPRPGSLVKRSRQWG